MTASKEAETLREYARWTDTVAVYPETHESCYLVLGIIEEIRELSSAPDRHSTKKEMGDVLWYLTRYIVKVLKKDIGSAWESTPESMQFIHTYELHKLAADLAGVEKKRLRDTDGNLPIDRFEKAWMIVRVLLLYFKQHSQSYELQDIIDLNKEKLTSRKERDVIKGSGDDR